MPHHICVAAQQPLISTVHMHLTAALAGSSLAALLHPAVALRAFYLAASLLVFATPLSLTSITD